MVLCRKDPCFKDVSAKGAFHTEPRVQTLGNECP